MRAGRINVSASTEIPSRGFAYLIIEVVDNLSEDY